MSAQVDLLQNWKSTLDMVFIASSKPRAELVAYQDRRSSQRCRRIEHTPKKKVAAPLRKLAQKAVKPLAMESTDYREFQAF